MSTLPTIPVDHGAHNHDAALQNCTAMFIGFQEESAMPRDTTSTILCRFRFLCDRRWDDLAAIAGQPDVRYCDGCEKPVFRCGDYDELAAHIAQQHCVAIPASQPGVMLIGDPAPGTY